MNDKLNDALAQLAAKLGVGVDYIWPILLRQVRVEAILDTILGIFFILVVAFAGWVLYYIHDDDEYEGRAIILAFVLIIGLFPAIGYSYSAICHWVNPEYVALAKILQVLK